METRIRGADFGGGGDDWFLIKSALTLTLSAFLLFRIDLTYLNMNQKLLLSLAFPLLVLTGGCFLLLVLTRLSHCLCVFFWGGVGDCDEDPLDSSLFSFFFLFIFTPNLSNLLLLFQFASHRHLFHVLFVIYTPHHVLPFSLPASHHALTPSNLGWLFVYLIFFVCVGKN